MTVCMYRDIHTLQPYIIDFTQRGCHTLRLRTSNLTKERQNNNFRGQPVGNSVIIRWLRIITYTGRLQNVTCLWKDLVTVQELITNNWHPLLKYQETRHARVIIMQDEHLKKKENTDLQTTWKSNQGRQLSNWNQKFSNFTFTTEEARWPNHHSTIMMIKFYSYVCF